MGLLGDVHKVGAFQTGVLTISDPCMKLEL